MTKTQQPKALAPAMSDREIRIRKIMMMLPGTSAELASRAVDAADRMNQKGE
jgi:hypothetical protein